MLNNFKYLLVSILLFSFANSQVVEKNIEFKIGEHNSLVIKIYDVDKKLVEDEWKSFNSKFGKTDKKKGEFINKKVVLEGISNPMDWYMKLDKKKGDVDVQLCVISKEEFLSSSNQEGNFIIVSKYLNDFSYSVEVAKVQAKFDDEKKELEKLQKSLKKKNNDIGKNNDTIDKHNKKIDKANKSIESNLKDQKKTNKEITEQRITVEKLLVNGNVPTEDSGDYKKFEKENDKLLKLQKKLEKLIKDYDGDVKTIDKSTKKVEQAIKDNKSDKKDVEKLKDKISKQGKLVESIRRQLESM